MPLPSDVLSALAAGGGGAEAARHLVTAQDGKHRLLLLAVVEKARRTGHPHAKASAEAFDLLADLEKEAPAAVRTLVRHPSVGAWALEQVRAPDGAGGSPGELGAIAAAAAVIAGVPCEIAANAAGGRVMLPAVGRLTLPYGGEGLTTIRVGESGPEGKLEPLYRLDTSDGAISLILDDLDDHRWESRERVEERVSAADRQLWAACLDDAWRILKEHHWTIAAELRSFVTVLTPIAAPEVGQNSSSGPSRFGTIALSTPPDGRYLASTFAHEIQHGKLNALLDLVRLLDPAKPDPARWYAPWRPDPRPLSGLIQGAYAFMGVAGFWRRQRAYESDSRPHIEFARWRESAHLVTGTLLDSGALTPLGTHFTATLRATLSSWLEEPVPREAREAARAEAAAHRAQWDLVNGVHD